MIAGRERIKGMPAGELAAKEIWEGAEGLSLSTPRDRIK
jgi:hypothetical protein